MLLNDYLSIALVPLPQTRYRVSHLRTKRHFLVLFMLCFTFHLYAATWYVRPDGGTRYSVNRPSGQCNGKASLPYPGHGVNQSCAFGDVRYLWADGSYATGASAPAWGWVGSSGDTYLIDCPADCRVGYNGPYATDYFGGIAGDPFAAPPRPPNGTASAHTKILGANFANCTSDASKAHLNGGYGAAAVFDLKGAAYVDVACFDITDHSSCGRAGQRHACSKNYPLDDYATSGIVTNNVSTNVTITDVRIHGMASAGMVGPTGNAVVLRRVALLGNPGSGWNMDAGDGTTGTGNLTLDHVSILWSGCAEEYPIVDALPYRDCTDDHTSGGYGDGLGTATVVSNPAWYVNVSNSVAAYNTQDGFDFLHLEGGGSRLIITNSLAYGNMGQQIKAGAASIVRNNLIIGNCNALRQPIPGTPKGYNSRLSDFCRAADTMVAIAVQDSAPTYFQFNTMYTASVTGVEINCHGTCTALSSIVYENNIFLGFENNAADGYPGGGRGGYANPLYLGVSGLFTHPGSVFSHNATFHFRSSWICPRTSLDEIDAICADPKLVDETWHLYGYGNMSPTQNSPVVGRGMAVSGVAADYSGATRLNPPTIGALDSGSNPLAQQITVNASPNPAAPGDTVLLEVNVQGEPGMGSAPAGAVMFLDGNKSLGIVPLDNTGNAILDVSGLPAGSHGIVAVYSGDEKYPPGGSGITPLKVKSPATTVGRKRRTDERK